MRNATPIKALLLLTLIAVGGVKNANAQFSVCLGPEATMVRSTFKATSSKGFGLSLGGEFALFKKLSVIAQAGYIYLIPEPEFVSS